MGQVTKEPGLLKAQLYFYHITFPNSTSHKLPETRDSSVVYICLLDLFDSFIYYFAQHIMTEHLILYQVPCKELRNDQNSVVALQELSIYL